MVSSFNRKLLTKMLIKKKENSFDENQEFQAKAKLPFIRASSYKRS